LGAVSSAAFVTTNEPAPKVLATSSRPVQSGTVPLKEITQLACIPDPDFVLRLRAEQAPLLNRAKRGDLDAWVALVGITQSAEQPAYETVALRGLVDEMLAITQGLVEGDFRGQNGHATRVLVGPKGVGKTTALKAFAAVAQAVFPQVVPIYINLDGNKGVLNESIGEHVRVAVGAPEGMTVADDISEFLVKQQQVMLLLVDEAATLYSAHVPRDACIHSLAFLRGLGSEAQTTGRVSAILCGSTDALPVLIHKSGDIYRDYPSLSDTYPHVREAESLNGDKYHIFDIFLSWQDAERSARAIVRARVSEEESPEALIKKIAICECGNAGATEERLRRKIGGRTASDELDAMHNAPHVLDTYVVVAKVFAAKNERLVDEIAQVAGLRPMRFSFLARLRMLLGQSTPGAELDRRLVAIDLSAVRGLRVDEIGIPMADVSALIDSGLLVRDSSDTFAPRSLVLTGAFAQGNGVDTVAVRRRMTEP
jgi:hypothetical protein